MPGHGSIASGSRLWRQLADAGHMPEAVEQLLRTADPTEAPLAGKSEHELAGLLASGLAASGADAKQVEELMNLFWRAEPQMKHAACQTVTRMREEQEEAGYEGDVILAATRGIGSRATHTSPWNRQRRIERERPV